MAEGIVASRSERLQLHRMLKKLSEERDLGEFRDVIVLVRDHHLAPEKDIQFVEYPIVGVTVGENDLEVLVDIQPPSSDDAVVTGLTVTDFVSLLEELARKYSKYTVFSSCEVNPSDRGFTAERYSVEEHTFVLHTPIVMVTSNIERGIIALVESFEGSADELDMNEEPED